MLFFQVVLLLGYAYAHASVNYLKPKTQVIVHLILLIIALMTLPITPSQRWIPTDPSKPILRILTLLTVSVGLPYLILSSTGPLLQAWFGRVQPGVSPYRLYALSNIASLLALVSYPFYFEPTFTRITQVRMWSISLVGFAILCGATAIRVVRSPIQLRPVSKQEKTEKHTRGEIALWILLPMCASSMFLSVTNKLCEDIAAVPLLWILPLAIYLLTFIITFDSPRWYIRPIWISVMAGALTWLCWDILHPVEIPQVLSSVLLYSLALFSCCMVCHGELYQLRPHAQGLTSYYLLIALGGALGGVAVGIVAPLVLDRILELNISIVGAAALALICLARGQKVRQPVAWGLLMTGLVLLAIVLGNDAASAPKGATRVDRSRNFYGVLMAFDNNEGYPDIYQRVLQHGTTLHGFEFIAPERQQEPTSYYGMHTGLGRTMALLQKKGTMRVGVIGLGIGTVLAYGRAGDVYNIYEINPDVVRYAREQFAFLPDCKATTDVNLGDARISLARQAPQQFDLLILDAFSGDAIPVHLLTRECFDIYMKHLKPGGVVAVHISNKYLDLGPVTARLAEHFHLGIAQVFSPPYPLDGVHTEYAARWMLLTTDQALLADESIRSASQPVVINNPNIRLWTDDDVNLVQILFSW